MTKLNGSYPDHLHNDDGSHRAEAPEVSDPAVFRENLRAHLNEHRDREDRIRELYKHLAATLTQLGQEGETIKIFNEDLRATLLPDGAPLILGSKAAFILQGATGGIGYYADLKAWDSGGVIQGLPKTATVTAEHLQALMNARATFPALLFSFGCPGNLLLWDSDKPSRSRAEPVVLRRGELFELYDKLAGRDDFDDAVLAAAQRIIDEALAKTS